MSNTGVKISQLNLKTDYVEGQRPSAGELARLAMALDIMVSYSEYLTARHAPGGGGLVFDLDVTALRGAILDPSSPVSPEDEPGESPPEDLDPPNVLPAYPAGQGLYTLQLSVSESGAKTLSWQPVETCEGAE